MDMQHIIIDSFSLWQVAILGSVFIVPAMESHNVV